MKKDPILEKITNMTNRKFCVYDEERKVMHEADEICTIHLDNGVPYGISLWNNETLMKTANTKGFILYSYKEEKKKVKGGAKK